MSIKIYKVGGCVRDELRNVKPKDVDYCVETDSYETMRDYIAEHGKIHIEHPEHFTVRGFLPSVGDVDFVLCRTEGPYTDGRRPDWVKPGTLLDDLARRDFTMNAIAKDESGEITDPYDGQEHIKFKIITGVGNTKDRMKEDALRLVRAVRFKITLDFTIAQDVEQCLVDNNYMTLLAKIPPERIRDELMKMFKHDTMKTLELLTNVYPGIGNTIFSNKRLWLNPSIREVK